MTTIAAAKAKLTMKQHNMVDNYNESIGSFLGIGAGAVAASAPGKAYAVKISDGSMPDRWEKNLRRAFGG